MDVLREIWTTNFNWMHCGIIHKMEVIRPSICAFLDLTIVDKALLYLFYLFLEGFVTLKLIERKI